MLMIASVVSFLVNSVIQLPSIFSVITWNFSNQIWLPILIVVLELMLVAGGFGLQKLEQNLSQGRPGRGEPLPVPSDENPKRKRKKKRRK